MNAASTQAKLVCLGLVVYLCSVALGALGYVIAPVEALVWVWPYLWLLGPAANLVYGASYLWPFAVGSVAVGAGLYVLYRGRRLVTNALAISGVLLVWALFGVLVYAPGM